jgi:hypothetical protein
LRSADDFSLNDAAVHIRHFYACRYSGTVRSSEKVLNKILDATRRHTYTLLGVVVTHYAYRLKVV